MKGPSIRDWARSADRMLGGFFPWSSPADSGDAAADGATARLFHCRDCDTVYVARDKSRCGRCEGRVTRVRASLRQGSD